MEEDSEEENYKKIFENIIDSNDLKDVYKDIDKKQKMTLKEVVLLQQELANAVANVSDIIFCNINLDHDLEISLNETLNNIMATFYKIALDFNETVVESVIEEIDFDFDDDESEEDE